MTIALPRQPHSDWLARLRTIMVLRPGQRVVHVPGIGVSASRRAVSVAAASWWLAGGAPAPVAAYQPKGAASLATSYVNLVNPGTYDAAPGTAPTLDANGWVFNGTDQYLSTGVTLSRNPADICLFVRCTGATRATLIGNLSANLCRIIPRWTPQTLFQYADTNAIGTLGESIDGVFALTFFGHYFNGVLDAAYSSTTAVHAGVCCIGGVPGNFNGATVQAAAIYFASTMTEAHVIAVSAAMAAL